MKNLIRKILKEGNDFDWAKEQIPLSRGDIKKKLYSVSYVGDNEIYVGSLIDLVHSMGLTNIKDVGDLSAEISSMLSQVHADSHSTGYDEARFDYEGDCDSQEVIAYNEGYDEGYEHGEAVGYKEGYKKGFTEAKEVTYDKAFEEGRSYEANLDSEEFEKREGSPYNPNEYDDDYNTYN